MNRSATIALWLTAGLHAFTIAYIVRRDLEWVQIGEENHASWRERLDTMRQVIRCMAALSEAKAFTFTVPLVVTKDGEQR